MQASMAASPLFRPASCLKNFRPNCKAAQVFWAMSEMPYLTATDGTLSRVWQRMGQAVQPLPRTVYFQASSPRKWTALLVR